MDGQFRVDKQIYIYFFTRDSICCDVVRRSLVALKCLMFQDETDILSRNVGNQIPNKKCNIAEGR